MVTNIEAEIQWTFAIALSVATVVAVSYGGGISPKACRWFFGLKRKWCLPMFFISIVLAAVFTVSGVAIFLWFRDRSKFQNDYYDSVLGLHAGVLGSLFFFGKFFFVWKNFMVSACFTFLTWAAAVVALVLLGIEGNRANQWAPFGLYFALPVFLTYLFCQICYIWWVNSPILKDAITKKKKYAVVSSSSSSYSGYSNDRPTVIVDSGNDSSEVSW